MRKEPERTTAASRDRDPRINHRIRVPEVRLVGLEGEQLGIVLIEDARVMAEQAGVDLVEVAPLAKPPVCRLMDFGKYKYQQKKRQQEARRSATQVEVKEIKLRPKTDDHDFDTKLNHVRRFLDQNNRVKVTMMFRGRERMYAEMQRKRMMEIAEQLADCAVLDVEPRLEGRNMSMMLNPKRGGSGSGSKEGREPPSAARGGEGEPVAS